MGKDKSEVRVTSATGGQKGQKDRRFGLVPVGPLEDVARLYAFGAKKYSAHNWRKGYDWSLSYDAAQRHLTQFWNGEDIDEESGLPHLASVVFHCFALMEFARSYPQGDDRPPPSGALYVEPEEKPDEGGPEEKPIEYSKGCWSCALSASFCTRPMAGYTHARGCAHWAPDTRPSRAPRP